MHMEASRSPRAPVDRRPMGAIVMAGLVLLALALAWKAWQVNQRLACWANQWPELDACASINGTTPPERVIRLKERLARNPGDARAAVELAYWSRQVPEISAEEKAGHLARASQLAPNDVAVLQMGTADTLAMQAWDRAVPLLVRLSTLHHDADASLMLADLVGQAVVDPGLQTALLAAARADTTWMDRVVPAMSREKIPLVTIMPLVNEAIVHSRLPPRAGQSLVRQLKGEGLWLEAHAIWTHLWQRPLPYVFNGDFETALVPGGFDWEIPGGRNDHRAGARISLVRQPGRGQVMRIDFTGRTIQQPMLRQHLILPPGNYRLTGQWQSVDLRSTQGLTWRLTCVKNRKELGHSHGLKAGGRDWQTLEWLFTVPADCGLPVELALVTAAPFEARTGLRGEIMLDRMELVLSEDAR